MKKAIVCKKWELPFYVELEAEDGVELHSRSYIHYIADHAPWVAAKSWATQWSLLNSGLDLEKEYTVREYFAGVGLCSVIIKNLFKVKKHVVSELDLECVQQLKGLGFETYHQDAAKAMCVPDTSDLKFLDLPNSSIIQIQKKWLKGFSAAFKSEPKLVMWTDTSVSYSIKIHGKKYEAAFGIDYPLNTKEEYVEAYSKWLYSNYGYSIIAAAFRGKNAVYFSAVPGEHETKMEYFPIEGNEDGFYFV